MGAKEEILKSVQTIVKGMMDKAPFDKTRMAQVIAINNNTLDVRMDGIKYANVKVYGNVNNIGVGDIVKIIIPENQTSRMFALSPNEKVELNTCPFPVDGIYMSMDSANPSAIWSGTTWSRISKGKVLVGVDENDADFYANKSGGSKTHTPSGTNSGGAVQGHTLTAAESGVPAHTHPATIELTAKALGSGSTYSRPNNGGTTYSDIINVNSNTAQGAKSAHTHDFTQPTFTDNEQNTMPPYMTCYIWQRTA